IGRAQAFLLTFIFLFLSIDISYSQDDNFPRGAQYFLGTDDQLVIKVNIWGFVAKPGQYIVPSNTDLISLISFAGGPREGAKLNNIKLIRATVLKDNNQQILNINVKKFVKEGDNSIIPQLKPGDTIIISGSKWYHISKYLEFMTKVAMLVQVYSWILYYANRN
ncbi:MAG: SLBB domain-containing protein, partial [Bacteroidales bacterium]|nr:SLBB domain-containing protein [Bacteroidales bacterium]